jgi:hypothetical protein
MGATDFSGLDDLTLLRVAAREIFYLEIVNEAENILASNKSYKTDSEKENYRNKVLKVAEAVIMRGVKISKKKTSGENWEMTLQFIDNLINGNNKDYGLKVLIKQASKDYCSAVGSDEGAFTMFESTSYMFKTNGSRALEAFEKDLL